jgi:hypothetical protein
MFQELIESRLLVQNLATALLFLIAIWKGKGPERACAGTMLAMILVDRGYHAVFGPSPTFEVIDAWHLLLDTGALFAFVLIALKANRFYPLVLAAAQLVAFSAHLVRMLVEPVSSLSYFLLYTTPFWFQLIVLAGGMAHHFHRSSILGRYPDWRDQLMVDQRARLS